MIRIRRTLNRLAGRVVTEDTAAAQAHLLDPFGLVSEVPGVEVQQASRAGEVIDFDPDARDRDFDEDDEDEDGFA